MSNEHDEMEKEFEYPGNISGQTIIKRFTDREFEMNKTVYKALLKVVEIVVPY